MPILDIVMDFFAGLFLCNCIPHLAAGLRGEAFPTPFAKPPGKGLSNAVTNALWGSTNLLAGLLLIHYTPIAMGLNTCFGALVIAFVLCAAFTAWNFEKVRNGAK